MLHRTIVVLLIIVSCTGLVLSFISDELRVTLPNGSKLVGRYLRSFSGRTIKGFTNIPYAKPPIGSLRFKDPQPLEKWDGEYLAIDDGPMCPQRNSIYRSFEDVGTEDCLRLNVYVPQTKEVPKSKLPVLVYHHHGSFLFGSASRSNYAPDVLLDEDIIFVAGNYRVGALGFLSTEDENAPGNFGLKDQSMILKWVHENIEQFGGDPNSVTIAGCSAGSAMTTYQMMSPLSKGLFHRAIAQAGVNMTPWALPARKGFARQQTAKLAKIFDCYTPNDWAQTVDCLRTIPSQNITATLEDFFDFDIDPMAAFKPVIEPESPTAFLTAHPLAAMSEQSIKTPLLFGVNHDDGAMKSAPILNMPGLFDSFASNVSFALPVIMEYAHLEQSGRDTITNKLVKFYFDNQITREKVENLTNLFHDGWFSHAEDTLLRKRMARNDAADTYYYLFTHKGTTSNSVIFGGDPNTWYGVAHGDEFFYLFPLREAEEYRTSLPTEQDHILQKAMVKLWTNFVRFGNPTPASSDLPKWDKVNEIPGNYYRIGNLHYENRPLLGMETGGFFGERKKLWRDLNIYSDADQAKNQEL